MDNKEDPKLTVPEVAKILGKTEYTVRKMIREGRLKAHVTPGQAGYRIYRSDLLQVKSGRTVPILVENLPEATSPALLATMLDKIKDTNPEAYKKILKQIFLEYCELL